MRKYRLTVLLFLFCIVLSSTGFARLQGQKLIDSLSGVLPNSKDDSNKVRILHDIAFAYWNINLGEGIKCGQLAYDLAAKLRWEKGQAMALEVLGTNYRYKSEYSTALDYYERARTMYERVRNKRGVAVT